MPTQAMLRERWGRDIAEMRFIPVPLYLVRFQKRLGLTSTELVLLLQLLANWEEGEEYPVAAHGDLARPMGLTPKSVRRTLDALEAKRLISRRPRFLHDGTQLQNAYDLSGLRDQMTSEVRKFLMVWHSGGVTTPF